MNTNNLTPKQPGTTASNAGRSSSRPQAVPPPIFIDDDTPVPPPIFMHDDDVDNKKKTKEVLHTPASRPGAMAVSGLDAEATVEAVESDLMIKQRVAATTNKPGAEAVVSGGMESDDAIIKQRVSAGRSSGDKKGPAVPASRPGAVTVSDADVGDGAQAEAVVLLTEQDELDRMAKKKNQLDSKKGPVVPASRPGAVTVSELDGAQSEAVVMGTEKDVAADIAIKQRVARDLPSGVQTTVSSGSRTSGDVVVASYEDDAEMASGGGSAPGAVQDQGSPPPAETSRERMDASTVASVPSSAGGRNTAFIVDDDEETGLNQLLLSEEESRPTARRDDSYKDIVVEAKQIDEDAERDMLPVAEAFNRNKGRYQAYRRPRFVALVIALVCIFFGIIVAIAVVVSNNNGGSDSASASTDNLDDASPKPTKPPTRKPTSSPTWKPTGAPTKPPTKLPTPSPSSSPTMSDQGFLEIYLAKFNISQASIDQSPETYQMALDWYVNIDEGRHADCPPPECKMTAKYPWDFTRFIMAWFYFAMTSNGTQKWTSCGQPANSTASHNCTWSKFESPSDDNQDIIYTRVPNTPRWLSRAKVLTWPGLVSIGRVYDRADPDQAAKAEACNDQLHFIKLMGFGLSGPLPYMLKELPCLVGLTIGWEPNLTGSLSDEFFNFTSTSRDSFTAFQLVNTTGVTGTIPDSLWDLPSLRHLVIGNTSIGGSLPDLTFSERKASLVSLQIFGNRFDDPKRLPLIKDYPKLYNLRLHGNGFTGQIPPGYGSLPALGELWLSDNLLDGPIPDTFRNASQMSVFRVEENELNGTFPNVRWSLAEDIQLQNNRFEGPLPANLFNFAFLKTLDCAHNNFNGTLATTIGDNLRSLEYLNLRDNMFSGPIPESLAKIKTLKVLNLGVNKFQGALPAEICSLRSNTTNGLVSLTTDCLGNPPQNNCTCCTKCCNSETGFCESTDNM